MKDCLHVRRALRGAIEGCAKESLPTPYEHCSGCSGLPCPWQPAQCSEESPCLQEQTTTSHKTRLTSSHASLNRLPSLYTLPIGLLHLLPSGRASAVKSFLMSAWSDGRQDS